MAVLCIFVHDTLYMQHTYAETDLLVVLGPQTPNTLEREESNHKTWQGLLVEQVPAEDLAQARHDHRSITQFSTTIDHWGQWSGQPGSPRAFRRGSLASKVPAEVAASDSQGRIWGRILGRNFCGPISCQVRTGLCCSTENSTVSERCPRTMF